MNTLETAQLMHTIHHANKLSEVRRCIPANETEIPMENNVASNDNKTIIIVLGVIFLAGIITVVYLLHRERNKLRDLKN